MYVCLFTCTTSRAIHLELAKDLSAETFLHLFRRFCARRSLPKLVISDNGTNFVASAKFFERLYEDSEVSRFMSEHRIAWKFIAPRAPWQGGFYERLIGIVKNCLRKVLYKKRLSFDELVTILAEVELRVNNRPLTYVSTESNELEALTPSHLVQGRRLNPMPELDNVELADPPFLDHDDLNVKYSAISKLLIQYQRLWKKDYLTALREKHYGALPANQKVPVKEGDVVLIECNGPRSEWPLGRVQSLHTDSEGNVRAVQVFSRGSSSIRTLEKLVLLEVSQLPVASSPTDVDNVEISLQGDTQNRELDATLDPNGKMEDVHLVRPKRAAAHKADQLRSALIERDQL